MKEVRKQLFKLQDKKYKEFQSSLCPNTNNIIGVRVPVLRKYAKELTKKYNIQELLKNIKDEYYEETMLKGMIIGISKENYKTIFKYIKEFVPKINNWAICDTFCAGLKITKKHKKEMWSLISKYLESKKEFQVRFAIVMILDYYIEEEYLKKDFEIFNSINNAGYYVKMAVAWAISISLVKYYEKTVKYLEKCNLDNFTYNKAIQKALESYRITKDKKQILRKLKYNRLN